jgi:hypothetical protein
MPLAVVLSLYAAIGAFVTAYAFYHGIVLRAQRPLITFTDQLILTLVTAAVGILWIFFVPGLAVVLARYVGRAWHHRPKGIALRAEQVRVRS